MRALRTQQFVARLQDCAPGIEHHDAAGAASSQLAAHIALVGQAALGGGGGLLEAGARELELNQRAFGFLQGGQNRLAVFRLPLLA